MTDGATDRIRLGTILAPSGVVVVIDPGYASPRTHAEEDFARDDGWSFGASALPPDPRFNPHHERISCKLEQGGCGEVQIHGVTTVVCCGVPADRELAVYAEPFPAEPMSAGVDEACWRKIFVEVDPVGDVASSEKIGETGVDWAGLMFVDAGALAHKGGDESQDIWESPNESGRGSRLCAFMTSLGDATSWGSATSWGNATSRGNAIFDVLAERDAGGGLVRLTVDCGNRAMEARQRWLEEQWLGDLCKMAVVSKSVLEAGNPVALLFREEPVGEADSGWVVTGGESRERFDDANNVQLVRLRELIHLHPGLDGLFRSPVGSAFACDEDGKGFVAVDFPSLASI